MASLRAHRRFFTVVAQFLPLIVGYARDRHRFLVLGRPRTVTPAMRRERAERLLDSFLTLGPTFIKLGQLLSTRPDILPPEYLDVIAQLQDQVPPAPWEDAERVVVEELGPVDTRFDAFDGTAISGASLGQVYRARLDGHRVAVKVRRPGIEDLVEVDLRVIGWLLPVAVRFVGESRAFSIRNIAEEFGARIREEMDYEREARMLSTIRTNFADDPRVRMPRVIESHSTERVLTMEYVDGTKITDVEALDAMGIDRSAVAETLQRTYLEMVIEDGVFHADPHPGNLAVEPDGTIVFYDFGMAGTVGPSVRDRIVDFYVGVANRDIDGILDALIALGTLSPEADRDTMGRIMELAIEDARGRDLERYRVQQIVRQVEDTIYEFPFRLPRDLALVLRVATVVEGVCVTLDRDFDFIAVATGFLTERGYREATIRGVFEDLGIEAAVAARSSLRIPPKVDRALDRLDRGNVRVRATVLDEHDVLALLAKRIVLGLVLAATLVTTAYLYPVDRPAALVSLVVAVTVAVVLHRSFRRPRGIRARPQFTRHAMRERQQSGTEPEDRP